MCSIKNISAMLLKSNTKSATSFADIYFVALGAEQSIYVVTAGASEGVLDSKGRQRSFKYRSSRGMATGKTASLVAR